MLAFVSIPILTLSESVVSVWIYLYFHSHGIHNVEHHSTRDLEIKFTRFLAELVSLCLCVRYQVMCNPCKRVYTRYAQQLLLDSELHDMNRGFLTRLHFYPNKISKDHACSCHVSNWILYVQHMSINAYLQVMCLRPRSLDSLQSTSCPSYNTQPEVNRTRPSCRHHDDRRRYFNAAKLTPFSCIVFDLTPAFKGTDFCSTPYM